MILNLMFQKRQPRRKRDEPTCRGHHLSFLALSSWLRSFTFCVSLVTGTVGDGRDSPGPTELTLSWGCELISYRIWDMFCRAEQQVREPGEEEHQAEGERDGREGFLLNAEAQGSFSDKVTPEQRPEGRAGGDHSGILGKRILDREKSRISWGVTGRPRRQLRLEQRAR